MDKLEHEDFLLRNFDKVAQEPEPLRRFSCATFVIATFLGSDFCEKYVFPSAGATGFLLSGTKEGRTTRIEYMAKVENLADALFLLRDSDGFEVILERLKHRDLRSAFFEVQSAAYDAKSNLQIKFMNESGIRGNDFDYMAIMNKIIIDREVSEIRQDTFAIRSIKNKLQEKRSQFNGSRPAVISIVLPKKWRLDNEDGDSLIRLTEDFLRSTRRVNAVIYFREHIVEVGEGAIWLVITHRHDNRNPRHPIDLSLVGKTPLNFSDMDELFEDTPRTIFRTRRLISADHFSFMEWYRLQRSWGPFDSYGSRKIF